MTIHLRSSVRRFVDDMLATEFAAVAARIDTSTPSDPFGLDHDCANPEGHDPVRYGRHFVCVNCSKVFE